MCLSISFLIGAVIVGVTCFKGNWFLKIKLFFAFFIGFPHGNGYFYAYNIFVR